MAINKKIHSAYSLTSITYALSTVQEIHFSTADLSRQYTICSTTVQFTEHAQYSAVGELPDIHTLNVKFKQSGRLE